MSTKVKILIPIFLALILAGGIFIGTRLSTKNSNSTSLFIYPRTDKISNILSYIESEYVDSVSLKKLNEDAIVAMLKDLDPHTVYIPAEELQEVNEPLEGNFSGIGVQFNLTNDTVVIINTIPNGPSARIGILAGDRIIKVNDSTVSGRKFSSEAIVKKLKGPRETKVQVSILRHGVKDLLKFTITRDNIPLYSIDIAYMLNDNTGYIKINQFSRTTFDEFTKAIGKLRKKGMKKLIVDLRDNGGGFLDAATNIADQFLPAGKLIVYTKGKSRRKESIYATAEGICEKDKIEILIDEYSASASEILAGAIQDNDRGKIIGRRSFGKGLVQEQLPLSDGSALRITVARYYTPTGRCIQKPYNKGNENYFLELSTRFKHGEFLKADSIKFNDSLKYTTPGGNIVYGGGGIMPDIFVPIDSVGITDYLMAVRNKGLIYNYAFEYTDSNRDKLKKFKTWQEINKFLDQVNLLNRFITYADKNGVKNNKIQVEISEKIIIVQLKAYIARNILDNEGFYPIIREIDATLQKSIEEISKD